jgi:hypothetical protein
MVCGIYVDSFNVKEREEVGKDRMKGGREMIIGQTYERNCVGIWEKGQKEVKMCK